MNVENVRRFVVVGTLGCRNEETVGWLARVKGAAIVPPSNVADADADAVGEFVIGATLRFANEKRNGTFIDLEDAMRLSLVLKGGGEVSGVVVSANCCENVGNSSLG